MSAALAPHCWNVTSFADPEYVMDLGSPNAFCALATTVFASCAIAFPERHAKQIATSASLFTTATPPFACRDRFLQRSVGQPLRLPHPAATPARQTHRGRI